MSPGRRLVPAHPEDPYDLDFTGLAEDLPPPPPRKPAPAPADSALIGALDHGSEGFHVVVARPHPQHARGRIILIIEDDPQTATRAAQVLSEAKYQPAIAHTPKIATQLMNKLGPPALILLNVDLPGVDGITFLERMRKHPRLQETPVILFTSHSHPDDVIRGLMAGADGYIAKPVAAPMLLSAVKTVMVE
jgi:CheY-like chemotaxis protein